MQVVAGDRRSGKTTELIKVAEKYTKDGNVLYITPNFERCKRIEKMIRESMPKEKAERIKVISIHELHKADGIRFVHTIIDDVQDILANFIWVMQSTRCSTISVDTTITDNPDELGVYVYRTTHMNTPKKTFKDRMNYIWNKIFKGDAK